MRKYFLLFLLFAFVSAASAQSDSIVMRYLCEQFGVNFSDNNRVILLPTGQEKFDDLFKAVDAARSTIHMEYFNFRNDSISNSLFERLERKVQQGVRVRVIFDGFGNSSNNRPLRRQKLDSIRARGVEIYEFDPMRFPYINHAMHRDHRKIVVIDGMIAYTGGMNVADYYIKGKPEFGEWRDLHMRVEGDVVGDLQKVFVNFWNKVTGDNLSGPELYPGEKDARKFFPMLKPDNDSTAGQKRVGVVNREPHATGRIITRTFVKAINAAEKRIQIINPYFTLNRPIRKALRKAVKRGVDVEIMVSAKSDIPITPRIVEYTVHRLMKEGAQVYFYEGGFHHTKIMMVDSCFSFVGSANLNSRSLGFDYECNLLIADSMTTSGLQAIFEHDKLTRCFPLTPERWQKFPRWQRFKGWIFHFLTPFVYRKQDAEAWDEQIKGYRQESQIETAALQDADNGQMTDSQYAACPHFMDSD